MRIGWPKTGWILQKQRNIWPVVQPISGPCEFEFVPRKRAVRDLVALIGNHTSKSEASIQCETALTAGETENYSTDQYKQDIKGNTKMYGAFGYQNKFKTETSVSRRRRIAQMLERNQSLLQYYNNIANCKIGILRTMDPTLHYKMKADEACDGSGERLLPRCTQRPRYLHRNHQYVHRDPMQTRRHQHRMSNRHQKQKQTIVSASREHRDGCTN